MRLLSPEVEVTRSLSNVIKYGRVFRSEEKKVIDSNKGSFTQISFRNSERIPAGNAVSGNMLSEKPPKEEIDPEEFLMEERERFLAEAEKILSDAKIQADFIVKEAESQSRKLKDQALEGGRQIGYQEGLKKAEEELNLARGELARKQQELEEHYQEELRKLEPVMAELTMGLVENITGVLLEEKKDLLTHLIKRALGQIKRNNAFLIKVSHEDFGWIHSEKEGLSACVGEGKSLEIEEDASLEKGQCMIETDDRIVDCGIGIQLQGLSENLKLLSRC